MTVATMLLGLVPIMWATGTGSDVMKRIAAPVIGGILTSFVLELVVYPAVYEIWKWDVGRGRQRSLWCQSERSTDAELESVVEGR
jgi:Cu/Ag efflux pump CusA